MDIDYRDILDIASNHSDPEERKTLFQYAAAVRRRERSRAWRDSVGFILSFITLVAGCAVYAIGTKLSLPYVEIPAVLVGIVVFVFGLKPLRKKLNAILDRNRRFANQLEDASPIIQDVLTKLERRELV